MKNVIKLIHRIQIGFLHAAYHRCMRRADVERKARNIVEFKKYVYRAEDAWRKIVVLTEKIKQNG